MLLVSFVADFYLPSRVSVSEDWAKNIFAVVRRFSQGLGRAAQITDLNTPQISNYLTAYAKIWSPRSTNDQRQILIMLWRSARKMRKQTGISISRPQPDLIRVVPEEYDPPEAWTFMQMERLIAEAERQLGMVGNVPASLFWPSLFSAEYWTACRIGAMISTPSKDYITGKGVTVRKQKNRQPKWYPLPQSCCELINATKPHEREMLFDWPHCRRNLFTAARKIIEAAGLPAPKEKGRQLFHRIRRTTITLCATVDPAIAQQQADHKDYKTTLKHYIDPSMIHIPSAADVLPDPSAPNEDDNNSPRLRIFR